MKQLKEKGAEMMISAFFIYMEATLSCKGNHL